MEITILFEDNEILVIDKPAGITVNRAETTKNETTIQDWSEERLGEKYKGEGRKYKEEQQNKKPQEGKWDSVRDFYLRGGIVHRLDKETSGVLILAKTPEAFVRLQEQFKERITKKVYWALTHGKVIPQEGEINVPVGRLPWNRSQFGIIPGGRESKTVYKVKQFYQNPKTKEIVSFLELYPHSGRTHQIRVHLKYIGHPIVSDFLYAGRKTARKDREVLERVFLHAARLSFQHPKTGETLTFESPLSGNLADFLQTLTKVE